MYGSRTHRGPHNDPPTILKIEEPTGAHSFPRLRILLPRCFGKILFLNGQNKNVESGMINGVRNENPTANTIPSKKPAKISEK
jgi:hypothetical protein